MASAEEGDKEVAPDADDHLEEHEPEVEHGEAQLAQVDGGESEQQDGEDDEGHHEREHGAPAVEQEAEDDGRRQGVGTQLLGAHCRLFFSSSICF